MVCQLVLPLRAPQGCVPARRSALLKHPASKSFSTQAWQSQPKKARLLRFTRNDNFLRGILAEANFEKPGGVFGGLF